MPFTTLSPTRLQPALQTAIGLWAWVGYIAVGGGLVPSSAGVWPARLWQLSSLVLVVLIVAALPWGQRRGPLTPRPSPVAARAADR